MSRPFNTIIAIDPGASGACVIRHLEKTVSQSDVYAFVNDYTAVDVANLTRGYVAQGYWNPVAVIERVWASPAMGVSSSFAFGENYGLWRGALKAAGVPVYGITPQEWSRNVCPKVTSAGADRKRDLRDVAKPIFPQIKVTLTNADALLISEFALNRIRAGGLPGIPL
jgi:hypothetical protein